jgi:hypothetical protein
MNDLSIETLCKLADVLKGDAPIAIPSQPRGFRIVVLDRGFVYVGKVSVSDDWCTIIEARNIRYWGTDETHPGLGWLAANGPTEKSKVDVVGTVHAPMRAVISIIDAREDKWNSH